MSDFQANLPVGSLHDPNTFRTHIACQTQFKLLILDLASTSSPAPLAQYPQPIHSRCFLPSSSSYCESRICKTVFVSQKCPPKPRPTKVDHIFKRPQESLTVGGCPQSLANLLSKFHKGARKETQLAKCCPCKREGLGSTPSTQRGQCAPVISTLGRWSQEYVEFSG